MSASEKVATLTRTLEKEKLASERFWKTWYRTVVGLRLLAAGSVVISILVAATCEQITNSAIIAMGVGFVPLISLCLWHRLVTGPMEERILRHEQQLIEAREQVMAQERQQQAEIEQRREAMALAQREMARVNCRHEWTKKDVLDNVRWGDGGMWITKLFCPKCGRWGEEV